ncbi:hypothetical protein Pth03_59560 [Planotetraspora thailandica]|uniref:Uncharacterized protein n=1 Tax=Planotetraspora thailandica TaxID=487172 RepID=A0A8J3V8S5_9ACTN|nr:hypothetical protein [Planotetraspora thailandica]GII57567.1 hypothetical protein Pth03_59560 [Planotetraspora thailandica]
MTVSERLIRIIVGLYPLAYRAEHQSEITSTARDSLAGRGPIEAVREAADLAVHALRQRIGLTVGSVPGTLAASAAPLAAASAIALSGVFLVCAEWTWAPNPYLRDQYLGHLGPFPTLGPIVYLTWLLVFLTTITGRSGVARFLTAVAVAASVAIIPLAWLTGVDRPRLYLLSALTLLGSIVLAAPVDPLKRLPSDRKTLVIATVTITGILSAATLVHGFIYADSLPWATPVAPWYLSPVVLKDVGSLVGPVLVTALIVSAVCMRWNRQLPLAIVMVALPWAVFAYGASEYRLNRLAAIGTCVAGLIALGLLMAAINAIYYAGRRSVPQGPIPQQDPTDGTLRDH